jgi:hypothetical protein
MLSEELDGLRAELESKDTVEVFSFRENSILATLGTRDGPVTAPILEYKVTSNSSLIVQGKFPVIWENLEFSTGYITVQRNGKKATYKTSKSPTKKQERKLP